MAAGKLLNSTYVYIVGNDMLKAFYKLFCLRFCVQVINEKTLCSKELYKQLYKEFEKYFYMKIIVN